ncbi:MAG: FliM/FliN family flagellar motor switch protein, partial [Candidatus Acidiferrum sp.]
MEPIALAAVQKFCDAWKIAFGGVLESLGATAVLCSWRAPLADYAAPAVPNENTIATRFQISKGLQGLSVVQCDKSVAVQFAQLLQSEALDPAAEFSEINRDAFAEFLRQIAGQVATEWKAENGMEIDLSIAEPPEPPSLPGTQTSVLEIKSDKFAPLELHFFLDPPLCAALVAVPPPEENAEALPTPALAADGELNLSATPNLALLLDVELQATIRFGQRDMLLREVFGLMPGAVVELDQYVNEPAE